MYNNVRDYIRKKYMKYLEKKVNDKKIHCTQVYYFFFYFLLQIWNWTILRIEILNSDLIFSVFI